MPIDCNYVCDDDWAHHVFIVALVGLEAVSNCNCWRVTSSTTVEHSTLRLFRNGLECTCHNDVPAGLQAHRGVGVGGENWKHVHEAMVVVKSCKESPQSIDM